MKRILIVEDDGAIAAIERDYLMLSDFQVDIAATGPEGLAMGRAGDVILLAGKGHETYQEVGEARLPLDEREEIASFFRESTL